LQILYVDEAGDLGALPAAPAHDGNDQPVLVICGLIVDAGAISDITHMYVGLKRQWFPRLSSHSSPHNLDFIKSEIKGSDLRRNAIRGSRKQRRHAMGFLDHLFRLIEDHEMRLLARIWIKGLGRPFTNPSVYTASMQSICSYFENYLEYKDDIGICIADSRNPEKNSNVAHSVFTQKFGGSQGLLDRIVELPTFGHSVNHAGIQICDVICSALLYPIAAEVYCSGRVANVHVQPGARNLREHFGVRLKRLQYRFQDGSGRWTGGIVVSDALTQRSGKLMFE